MRDTLNLSQHIQHMVVTGILRCVCMYGVSVGLCASRGDPVVNNTAELLPRSESCACVGLALARLESDVVVVCY